MPEACRKAFLPTTALFGGTAMPERSATSRDSAWIPVVSRPVATPRRSPWTRSASATSSSEVLPARSPIALTVTSTCLAPAAIAARLFAVARPRSSWPWNESTAASHSGTRVRRPRIIASTWSGVAKPTVSGRLMVPAPASSTARTSSATNAGSARVASIGLNSTSSVKSRALRTMAAASATTWARVFWSWCASCMSLAFTNTWIRRRRAWRSASPAAATSLGTARASAQIVAPRTFAATSATAAPSSGELTGKPASITSTPSAARSEAISSLSCAEKQTPAVCSPSRSVVSKIRTRSGMTRSFG